MFTVSRGPARLSAFFFFFTRHKVVCLLRAIHGSSTVLKVQLALETFTACVSADAAFTPVYSVMSTVCCCFCEAGILMNTRFEQQCFVEYDDSAA